MTDEPHAVIRSDSTPLSSEPSSESGYYLPDRYFIAVEKEDAHGAPDPRTMLHEFWHYLQNVSTLHGIQSFAATQQVMAVFSATMATSGVSLGDAVLAGADRDRSERFVRWRLAARGDEARNDDRHPWTVTAINGPVVTLERRADGARRSLTMGAHVIKEGVAHLVERQYADLIEAPRPESPEFPYALLDRVVEFVTGRSTTPDAIVAGIGTLSLLTNAPALATVDLARRYQALRDAGASDLDALHQAGEEIAVPDLRAAAPAIRAEMESLRAVHAGRGMLEHAVALLAEECLRALDMRLDDPLFDLRPLLAPAADPAKDLFALVLRLPPPIMRFDGAFHAFRPQVPDHHGHGDAQYWMALHAQQAFMMMHAGLSGFRPSDVVEAPCPFADGCDHSTRSRHPQNCTAKPWKNYVEADEGCWFTEGVAATIGRKPVG